MSPALEKRDVKQRLAVHLEEIEGGEDLLTCELARVRVAKSSSTSRSLSSFQPSTRTPSIGSRCCTGVSATIASLQLREAPRPALHSRGSAGSGWPTRTRTLVPVHAGSRMWPSRSLVRGPTGAVGARDLPRGRCSGFDIRALDMANVRSIMRTPVRNWFPRVHRGSRICASLVFPSRGVPLPITTARRGGIRRHGGCHPACTHPSLRDPGRGPWPSRPARKRRPPRVLAERGAASSAQVDPARRLFLLAVASRRHDPGKRPARLVNSVG